MNQDTVFIYENSIGSIRFAFDSDFWITDATGISSVDVDISGARSRRQIGASITNQSVAPRVFTLDGVIFEPLATNRQQLIDIVAPMVNATLTMVDGDESWYLDVVPERSPEISPGEGDQEFQMRLYAAYPYLRTTKHYSTMIAGLVAMFEFPFYTGGSWYISRFSEDYFKPIINNGNVPIEFKVVFTARSALSNPELYHVGTEKIIRFNKEMVAGEQLIVSTITGERGVVAVDIYGNTSNGFRYLTIDSDLSMSILPGDNLFRADATNNRQGLGCHIQHPEGEKSGG